MATAQTGSVSKKDSPPFELQKPLVFSQIDATTKLNLLTEELKQLKLQNKERKISYLDTISSTINGEQIYGGILIIPVATRDKTSYLLPTHRDIFTNRQERSIEVDIRNDSPNEVEIKPNGSSAILNGSGIIDSNSGSRWYLSTKNGIYSFVRLT